jgi:hypothetical protein
MQTITKPARLEQNLGWITLLLLHKHCPPINKSIKCDVLMSVEDSDGQPSKTRCNEG